MKLTPFPQPGPTGGTKQIPKFTPSPQQVPTGSKTRIPKLNPPPQPGPTGSTTRTPKLRCEKMVNTRKSGPSQKLPLKRNPATQETYYYYSRVRKVAETIQD